MRLQMVARVLMLCIFAFLLSLISHLFETHIPGTSLPLFPTVTSLAVILLSETLLKDIIKNANARLPAKASDYVGHFYCQYDPKAVHYRGRHHPVCAVIVITSTRLKLRAEVQDYAICHNVSWERERWRKGFGWHDRHLEELGGVVIMDIVATNDDNGATLVSEREATVGTSKFIAMNMLSDADEEKRTRAQVYTKLLVGSRLQHVLQDAKIEKIDVDEYINNKVIKTLSPRTFPLSLFCKYERRGKWRATSKGVVILRADEKRAIAEDFFYKKKR